MKLGDLLVQVDERNTAGSTTNLLGVAIEKRFMPSVANVIGTDLTKYKLVSKNRFACNPMHVGRDEKLPIARYDGDDKAIVSPAYFTFDVAGGIASPRYLELWFSRSEFDRRCWFATDASVRGGLSWDALCDIPIELPSVAEQQAVVDRFDAIEQRIVQLRLLNDKLAALIVELRRELASDCAIVALADRATMQYGYTQTATEEKIGPRFLRITDISSGWLDWGQVPYCEIDEKQYKKYVLNSGDVVVARTGVSAGAARYLGDHIPDAVFASFLVRIRTNNPIEQTYTGLTIASSDFFEFVQSNAGGSAQPQANPPLLGKYEYPLPSETQLEAFNAKVKPLVDAIEHNESEATLLHQLQQALLSSLSLSR